MKDVGGDEGLTFSIKKGIAFLVAFYMKKAFGILLVFFSLFTIGGARTVPKSAVEYDLDIKVVPDAYRIEVKGSLTISAVDRSRSQLNVSLSGMMHDVSFEVIEPAESAGPAKIESSDTGDKSIRWSIYPQRPIPAGTKVILRFSYAGGEKLGSMFYIGPEVSFASAWGTDWYPLIDADDRKSVGMLRISVPPGQTVCSTGILRSPLSERNSGIFRFETIHPTYFSFAAGNYKVTRGSGRVPIVAYLLSPRPKIGQYLDGVSKILSVLSKEFGSFPFGKFSLVEIPRDLAGRAGFNGAAMQGFIFLNSRAFDVPDIKYVLNFLGHEFTHEWFPHYVALKTPPGLYMEEALAEYGGLRVVETLAGADAAEKYRRTGFEYDPGFSALQYFKLLGSVADHPLSTLQENPVHRNLAYNKGFLVFDMLSREVGRKIFQRTLHRMAGRYAYKEVSWEDFLHAFEVGGQRNLRWFYDQWFNRTGAPEFHLTWTQSDDAISGVITQPPPYYMTTVYIEAGGVGRQRITRSVKIQGGRTVFSFSPHFTVKSITVDPHYLVLHWTPEYRNARDAAQ